MDLFGIASAVSGTITPPETVQVKRSTGYTVGTGRKQVPSYAPAVSVPANIQALDSVDLRQMEGINIQGTIQAIYLRGTLAGVIRPGGTGGDLVLRGPNFSETWLVVKVLESWPTWTKAAIVRQM